MASSSGYTPPALPSTPEEVFDESAAYMASVVERWEPHAGEPDTMLLEANARPAAETREAVLAGAELGFLSLGSLVGAPRIEAASASVQSTWTFTDTDGHTIEDGTEVLIGAPDAQIAFAVEGDVVVDAGAATTGAGEVTLVAIEAGTAGNDLTGPAALVQHPAHIDTITIVGTSANGVDLEDEDVYRDRLADELELVTPSPVMENDFAVLYRRFTGAERAIAVDTYNPNTNTYDVPLVVAVCGIDELGAPLSTGVKNAGKADLEAMLLQNCTVYTFDPTISEIDVTWAAKPVTGYDAADVQERGDASLVAYLDPAWWGQPSSGDERGWIDELVVREYELAEVLNRVDGLWYITDLQLRRKLGAATFTAASDLVTMASAHQLSIGDEVVFSSISTPNNVTDGTTYFVKTTPSATTFTISATLGGSTRDITANSTGVAHTAMASGDVAIPGPAALATAGTITGTVTA